MIGISIKTNLMAVYFRIKYIRSLMALFKSQMHTAKPAMLKYFREYLMCILQTGNTIKNRIKNSINTLS